MVREIGFRLKVILLSGFNNTTMHTLFEDKPVMLTIVKVGIVAFIALSIANLYYSIKVNKALADKTKV
jgi:hypothetical protein